MLNTLSTLFLAGSSLSNCSSGTMEKNYVCDQNGCQLLSEEEGVAADSLYLPEGSTLEKRVISSATGRVEILGQEVRVVDEDEQPLGGIEVYGQTNSQGTLFLAIDPSAEHYPDFQLRSTGKQDGYANRNFAQKQDALQSDGLITLVMETYQWGKNVLSMLSSTQGDLLSDGEDSNLYCMTRQQMKNNYVLVPAGIIVLALPEGTASKILKIADGIVINEIFNTFVQVLYGEQEGYLISAPRTAIDLCADADHDPVCPITTESLSQQLWGKQGIPYWEIIGACTPSTTSSSSPSPPPYSPSIPDQSGEEDPTEEAAIFKDPLTGLYWQKEPSSFWMTRKDAHEFCSDRNDGSFQDWRVPYGKEMYTLKTGTGNCLLNPALDGPCGWYWIADDTCIYASEPYLQVTFDPDSWSLSECVPKGVVAYVRCVRK